MVFRVILSGWLATSEIGVGGSEVVEALVISPMVVVIDECRDTWVSRSPGRDTATFTAASASLLAFLGLTFVRPGTWRGPTTHRDR